MHREIGCDKRITDTGSLRERDGAQENSTSSDIFGDITSIRLARLFISSEAFTRNRPCSNGEIRTVEASIVAVQTTTQLNAAFHTLEYDISAEKDELKRIQMQEFAIPC